MVPRAQIAAIAFDASLDEVMQIVIESGHSRFPVHGENRDEVIGLLLAKDLLKFFGDKEKFNIHDILRPAVFIPESKRLDVLLKEFRLKHNHMAIVADEYGGVAGIVTIEDVLEQIVGRIEDEYDFEDTGSNIRVLNDLQYAVKGATPIADFNIFFNTKFNDDQFDTIGGLVTHAFAHVPKDGEMVKLDHLLFKVLNADKRRIRLLRVELQKKKTTAI
jgi:magnesium and cobalt transporter